jgi:hypothetical protein
LIIDQLRNAEISKPRVGCLNNLLQSLITDMEIQMVGQSRSALDSALHR